MPFQPQLPALSFHSSSPSSFDRPRQRLAFGWYGGKYSHLDWLLPRLPPCHHYCEPFGGSAAVLLNRSPSPLETYNDLDGEVVNFFRVLREQPEALIRAVTLTPFSRAEFTLACQSPPPTDELERARRFYVLARQVRTGLAQSATPGRWAHCTYTSRRGMSGSVSRWTGGIAQLSEVATRLLSVQFENAPAVEVIRRYDTPETLFYCDPPYPHEVRRFRKAYAHEMSDDEHLALAAVLASVRGKVAISGYACSLMEKAYPPPHWHRHVAPPRKIHSTKEERTEVLWTNYALPHPLPK